MNLDGSLVLISLLLLPFSLVGVALLVNAAIRKPRIGLLTDRAVIAVDIAVMVVSGVVIQVNRMTNYSLFPIEVARITFLLSLLLLEIVPVYWFYLWFTHRLAPVLQTAADRALLLAFADYQAAEIDAPALHDPVTQRLIDAVGVKLAEAA